jgi:gamma-glutamyltranspeptidase / glutathione hydrolase
MRFKTISIQDQKMADKNSPALEPSRSAVWRQFALATALLGLAACSPFGSKDDEGLGRGTIGYVKGFIGGVAADEPRAVLIGRDVLSAGGTAADAAVAVYFALSVTLPSSASLGGGGVCLVRDQEEKTIETLDFRALAPKGPVQSGKIPVAVPGNPFGFYALHTKYGRLKWGELIRPSENLARFGNQISRSLGQDLALTGQKLLSRPDSRQAFADKGGKALLREGDFVEQTELSGMLARIRSVGGAKLYSGPFARDFVSAVDAVGGGITYENLRAYRPQWRSTISVSYIKETALHFPLLPGSAGATAAQVSAMMEYDDLYADSNPEIRAHLLAETIERSLADRKNWDGSTGRVLAPDQLASPEHAERLMRTFNANRRMVTPGAVPAGLDPLSQSSSSSFSVMDRHGSAVSCSLSMNKPFGSGLVARGTGVVLAAPADAKSGAHSFANVMLVSKIRNAMYYVSSASGGALAATSMVNVSANALTDEQSTLESAMNLKRIHHGGADGITYVESGTPKAVVSGLKKRGHKMAFVNSMGVVNAVFCVNGIPHEKINCSARTDPRGFGLALSTE